MPKTRYHTHIILDNQFCTVASDQRPDDPKTHPGFLRKICKEMALKAKKYLPFWHLLHSVNQANCLVQKIIHVKENYDFA